MKRMVWIGGVAVGLIVQAGLPSFAQVIERNDAQIRVGNQRSDLPGSQLTVSNDETAFGVTLKRLAVVNARDGSSSAIGGSGVDLSGAEAALQTPELKALLQPFVGQALSQKLVDDIRALITQYYRDTDRPLVAVTIPAQEISDGDLRVEVLPFHLAKTKTEGNQRTSDEHLKRNVRAKAGEEINSQDLIEDANWLNLNPYRNLSLVFEPGQKNGTINLILRSNEQKPWSVYSGVNNGGTSKSDPFRFYTGFNIANLPLIDQQISYQFTGSGRALSKGRVFGLDKMPGYVSHSLSTFNPMSFPNGWRHKAQLQASYVESFANLAAPFTQANKTFSVYGDYAIPLPNLGAIKADLYGGLDFKRQTNEVFFSGALANASYLDILQGVLGVRGQFSTPLGFNANGASSEGRSNFDLRFVTSPGGLTRNNTNAAFIGASGNAAAKSRYAYLYGTINHVAPLPTRFSIHNQLAFQIATTALPGLEQFSIGGANSVRGYLTNEVSGDDGVSLRNELVLPSFSTLGNAEGISDHFAPFLFADVGFVRNRAANAKSVLAGVGVGFDYSLSKHFSANAHYGYTLINGPQTKRGSHTIFGNLTVKF